MPYHQTKLLPLTLEKAQQKITEELQSEGFGILTEIDVSQTLKQKLDLTIRRYRILGACHPQLASQAIAMERYIGLLMPCNVLIQEVSAAETEVSVIDPSQTFLVTGNQQLSQLAAQVRDKLAAVLARI